MEESNFDCKTTPQTDFEKVVQIVDEARKLHFDNKTPSDIDVDKLYKYAYDKLFGYRDSHQTVLSCPQRHDLIEVFKELKFGRPVEDQRFLQKCINYAKLGVDIKDGTFSQAIEALKQGEKVARKGWNGKGMYLFLIGENGLSNPNCKPLWTYANGVNDNYPLLSFIAMKTVGDEVVPWLASQTDMLSEDWEIVE